MSYSRSRSKSKSFPKERKPRSRSNSCPNKDLTCIHVSNIASKVTDTDLKELFDKYGTVDYVKICMEPKTQGKVSRGFGFVNFNSVDEANSAFKKLQEFEYQGKKMHLEFAKRAQPRGKTPGRYAGYVSKRRSRSRSRSRRRYRSSSSDSYLSKQRRKRSRRSRSKSNRRRSSSPERKRKDQQSRSKSRRKDDKYKRR